MDLELCQLDIDTFLYASIKEDVYIPQPLGFTDGTPKVCHLQRYLQAQTVPPRVQHLAAGIACRQWMATMRLLHVHLHLPNWTRLLHDRHVRR
jgi:hypothetical protein